LLRKNGRFFATLFLLCKNGRFFADGSFAEQNCAHSPAGELGGKKCAAKRGPFGQCPKRMDESAHLRALRDCAAAQSSSPFATQAQA